MRRDGSRWQFVPGSDWTYDAERYAQVTALRRTEQAAMAAFGADGRCLMRALQEQLDDPAAQDCGRCSVCTAPRFASLRIRRWWSSRGATCARGRWSSRCSKMAPDAAGTMRKIAEEARTEPGWALARFGDGGWWPAIDRGLRAGRSTTRS